MMRRRIRAWLLYHFFQPRTYAELMDTALSLFPDGGEVCEDNGSQLLVYTGLTARKDGSIEVLEPDAEPWENA